MSLVALLSFCLFFAITSQAAASVTPLSTAMLPPDVLQASESIVKISIGSRFRPFSQKDISWRAKIARRGSDWDGIAKQLRSQTELHRFFLSVLPERPLIPEGPQTFGSGVIIGDGSKTINIQGIISTIPDSAFKEPAVCRRRYTDKRNTQLCIDYASIDRNRLNK
jgi:hypothetical protein